MINSYFSQKITVFHGRRTPEEGYLTGYGALISTYALRIPLPDRLSIISLKHKKYETAEWLVFTPRHQPENTLAGHLTFALKYEGIELHLIKALFEQVNHDEVTELIKSEPTSQYRRRIWFLYEWLTERRLDIADLTTSNLTDLVDDSLQYPGPSTVSKRHRVRNNLPGVRDFCPMIRRTPKIDEFLGVDLKIQLKDNLGEIRKDIIARAASFLLLKDSKASYAIEGENPPYNRVQRWGKVIQQAGEKKLDKDELIRLQQIVIDNPRFTKLGWRTGGGFVGEHDRDHGTPIPEHISARWQDIKTLLEGLLATHEKLGNDDAFDAVLLATIIAFGFVFIHPFADGNGRIHRYLVHHVLGKKGFVPAGMIFPVSSVILERLEEYKEVLKAFSHPRLDFIPWQETSDHNVEVLNETIDLYRYFDATKQAEFLYSCVQETIDKTIPNEVKYLRNYDTFKEYVDNNFQMPDQTIALLVRFLEQGKGKLSQRALENEFSGLNREEALSIEENYRTIFFSPMKEWICDAIKNKQRIKLVYNGKERVIEPQCYGIGARGTELLRGYEIKGSLEKTNKLFDLSKATDIELTGEHFNSPGPGYQKDDSAMSTLFCQL